MNNTKKYALCIDNSDYEASLIVKKVYEILQDDEAAQDDFIRVIDESGEDYLYHQSHFILVAFPYEVEQVLATVTS
jgi:hypothetical protein